jgi:hypothetical protein
MKAPLTNSQMKFSGASQGQIEMRRDELQIKQNDNAC